MSDYNGWKNWETWVTNLHFGESFDDECQYMDDGKMTGERCREVVENWIDAIETPKHGLQFFGDVIGGFLGEVDWDEIAEHYVTEPDEPEADAGLDAWRDKEHETDGEA